MLLGQSYSIKGYPAEAIRYWTIMDEAMPSGILAKLALIELYIKTNDHIRRTIYVDKLKNVASGKSIQEIFAAAENENPAFPIYMPDRSLLEKILSKE